MGVRWPRTLFGVEIIYMRDYVARKVTSVVPGGRGVWALLPDGRVATNDADFFRHAYGRASQAEVQIAEKLWRLGKLPKREYQKLSAAYDKKRRRENQQYAVSELRDRAKQLGIILTKEQQAAIDKLVA